MLPTSSPIGFTAGQNDTAWVYVDEENPEYGGYYSFAAATAGEGKAPIEDASTDHPVKFEHSICPKNWRLPDDTDSQNLATAYNNNSNGELPKAPANFVFGGYYSPNVVALKQGEVGVWWLSVAKHTNNALNLIIGITDMNSHEDAGSTQEGMTIRCIAK